MLEGIPQRGRGRPRKYPPKANGDFETTKYDIFFTLNDRGPEEGKDIDINTVVQDVYQFIFLGQNSDKLFSKPNNYQDNPILNNLVIQSPISNKKNAKNVVMIYFMNICLCLKIRQIKNILYLC